MDKEQFYEYLEEMNHRDLMQALDAAVNRYHELHPDRELVLISLPTGEGRQAELDQIMDIMKQEK